MSQPSTHLLQFSTTAVSPIDTERAFTAFFEQTHVMVFRYIYGLHGGPTENVEDLTAETYLRAWQKRQAFQGDEQAAIGWIFRIAHNLVVDSHRRSATHPPPDALPESLARPEDDPEHHTLAYEQAVMLNDALTQLPLPQREMVVLRYMLGWAVKDIAVYLGKNENTVSVNIRRALQHLRENWPTESKEG